VSLWWDMGKACGAMLGILIYRNLGHDLTWFVLSVLVLMSLGLNLKSLKL